MCSVDEIGVQNASKGSTFGLLGTHGHNASEYIVDMDAGDDPRKRTELEYLRENKDR